MRRVSWRLMPFLLAAYLICYIDRVNVGFAALQMNKAVGIDPKTFGLGAGIFFVGYFILEVPSNLALERFGARKWIARIMITWGLVSAAFALIGGPISFLVLRFIAGRGGGRVLSRRDPLHDLLVPGGYRAKIVGIFMVAIPVAGMIGSPISGAILYMDGVLGLGGWQWIFILEAAPAFCWGRAFFWLTDRPEHAGWLAPEQKAWLIGKLDDERTRAPKHLASFGLAHHDQQVRADHGAGLRRRGRSLDIAGVVDAATGEAVRPDQLQTGLVNAIPFASPRCG
jgi:MFS transporter, ACS family, tartrate transporter